MRIDQWEFKDDVKLSIGRILKLLDLAAMSQKHSDKIQDKYGMDPIKLKEMIIDQMEFLNESRVSGSKFDNNTDFLKFQEVYAKFQEHFLAQIGK